MNKQEIIDLWKEYDIDSVEKYKDFLNRKKVDEKEFARILNILSEKLNYDSINPKEFWLACDEVFGIDPVCNIVVDSANTKNKDLNSLINNIDFANTTNLKIPKQCGMLGLFDLDYENTCFYRNNERCKVGEIGTGLGCFKKYVEQHYPKVDYFGFDVVSRVEGCTELENGCFSDDYVEQNKETFDVFYSCNVFQHISIKSTEKYFEQVSKLLKKSGYFLCSGVSSANKHSLHYGQVIKCLSFNEVIDIATKYGFGPQSMFSQQGNFSIFYINHQKIQ